MIKVYNKSDMVYKYNTSSEIWPIYMKWNKRTLIPLVISSIYGTISGVKMLWFLLPELIKQGLLGV